MDTKYLWKRHNTYWVRVRVPDAVRHLIGKAELSKNLYTKDLAEANRLKHREVSRLMKQIDLAKKRLDGSTNPPSKEEILREFASSMRDLQENAIDADLDEIQDAISTLIEDKISDLYGQQEAEAIFHGHEPEYTGKPAKTEAIEATKDAFRIIDIHSNPLSQVASLFLDEEEKVLKKASFRRKKKNIENFIRWSGNIDIDKVTRKIAGDYITRIIKNKNPSYDTLRNITADIGSMFSWAENRMDLERNPFHRQKIPKIKRGSQDRKPWRDEDIIKFLSNKNIRRNDFLATVIALYTGMRLEEICQLKSKDIFDRCFHVQEGKTDSASRVIPIHPVLEKLISITDYDKEDYLIHDLNPGDYDNKRSWNFQKRQGRLRKEVELPKGLNFHSLRNTLTTRMENAGVPRNHISQLMGHEDGNMALDVYSGGLAIEPLRKSMGKLSYGEFIHLIISKLTKIF